MYTSNYLCADNPALPHIDASRLATVRLFLAEDYLREHREGRNSDSVLLESVPAYLRFVCTNVAGVEGF